MRSSRWSSPPPEADTQGFPSSDEPPPLPPDDPPPLPPTVEDPSLPSANLYDFPASASQAWAEDQVHQGWQEINPNYESQIEQRSRHASSSGHMDAAGNAGPSGAAFLPVPPPLPSSEDAQHNPDAHPPPPPSPPRPPPWDQAFVGHNYSTAVPVPVPGADQQNLNPSDPSPPDDSAPWLNQSTTGEAQGAVESQQWQQQWYQGYEGYSQAYTQYEGYAAYPQQQYQQTAAVPGYYEGQASYAQQQSYPWNQTQVAAIQPVVPTKNEVDAFDIFKSPGRHQRAAKIAIIMRGLPGSGKTHIAKRLREIEVEQGGEPPRIHALDDYFVTEVEKEITDEQPGKRPKKRIVTVMEYLYEQELEDSYKASILKAFTKTVEEGRFPFVILDAPNIQVEDFRPFYMAAQRVGYVVYVLKPLETDPEVCFKRNIHQRDRDTISDLAAIYEATPNLFTQILVDSLFDLPKKEDESEEAIEEVDMEDEAKEIDENADQPQIKSRWASLEDEMPEEEQEVPRKKKKRKTEEQDSAEVEGQNVPSLSNNGKVARRNSATSILKQAGSKPSQKELRWADEVVSAEGFTIGGSAQQLEKVHHLEGLGPSPDESQSHLSHQSFKELARKERITEKHSFRDILLGKGPG